MGMDQILLRGSGIGLRFGREEVLRDVNLSIRQGEKILLSGENGAGKSTLLLVLAGVRKPERGSLTLGEGLLISGRSGKRRRPGAVAYVPQEPALMKGLTVADNLSFWAQAAKLKKTERRQQIAYLEDVLMLGSVMKKRVERLSGGMQKRVNLAASLFGTPRLLLLDEAFANVDAQSRDAIYELLTRYQQAGCSIVLVSHLDERAEAFADRKLTLEEGVLRE